MNGGNFRRFWFSTHEKSSEVHFKGRHLSNYPWGEEPQWPHEIEHTIPVVEFCHDTHNVQFDKIMGPNGDYELIPQRKFGKNGYFRQRELFGASYTSEENGVITDDTHYRIIPIVQLVLPGYYIWWSIHKTDNPPPPHNTYVSSLFSNPPSSVYGSKRISIKSRDLLQRYQHGFEDEGQYPRLQFRNGGTLRYKREICYVVIVCAEDHFNGADADDYPVIDAFDIDYEATRRIGNVGDWSVTIKNGITWKNESYSWDHFVFAFHYPTNEGRLCLPSGLTVHEDIAHAHESCQKRVFNDSRRLVCPELAI